MSSATRSWLTVGRTRLTGLERLIELPKSTLKSLAKKAWPTVFCQRLERALTGGRLNSAHFSPTFTSPMLD